MKNWNYEDEKMFKNKLDKLGVVKFNIELQKKFRLGEFSDDEIGKVIYILDRLQNIMRAKHGKQENKKKYFKSQGAFRFKRKKL